MPSGKGRLDFGLAAREPDAVEQSLPRLVGTGAAGEVDVDDLRKQSGELAGAHANRNEASLSSHRILRERGGPLRLSKRGCQIGFAEHRDRAVAVARGLLRISSTKFVPGRKSHAWIRVV